ncbi:hypothetical protein ELI43_13320 [Rhizobium leguminosarum]|uniref:hypothetical protein n=1 Tax=Rhizobium leguminosarum TaxID=384 RepID=UPI001030C993|nr:hypothetical protein [Rhizobium leguminosarum]TAU53707.1 hypothetical protein ELI43_13320 [Rhizobium leguminosarum]
MNTGLTKHSLLAMDPDTRAFTLVGAFMGYFALLEAGINSALGEVLEVKGIRGAIIARNMSFDDKIKTLRTLVDLFIFDKAQAKNFDDLARRARKFGEIRNVVAHTPFRRSPKSDGVEFFPLSAASTLKFPDMDWPIDEFLRQIDSINETDNGLRSIESKMSIQRIAQALIQSPPPKGSLGGLFGLGEHLMKPSPVDGSE